ncbi:MAG TPA: MFS transporter [Dehalococcoidia bacterium]|nr:MFS transporter [Dehalococcoidia bacterium]
MQTAKKDTILTWPFILSCITIFFAGFAYQILMPVVPLYVLHVGGKESQVGVVMGVAALTALLLRPLVGYSADRWGRKPLVILGPATYLVTALVYPFAGAVGPLVAVRVLHGFGLAANSTGLTTYVADRAPPHRRAEMMGTFGAALNIASATGPFVGFWLLDTYGFDSVFMLSGVMAAIGVLLGSQIPERWERKQDEPSTPGIAIPFSSEVLFPSILCVCVTVTFGAVTSYLAVLSDQEGIGNPGVFFLTYSLTLILVRLVSGRLADRFGRIAVVIPGFMVLAGAMLMIAATTQIYMLAIAAVIYGMGFGSLHPTLLAMVVDRAKPGKLGVAMGTFSGAFDLGSGGGGAMWGLAVLALGVRGMYLTTALAPLLGLLLIASFRGERRRQAALQQVTSPALSVQEGPGER